MMMGSSRLFFRPILLVLLASWQGKNPVEGFTLSRSEISWSQVRSGATPHFPPVEQNKKWPTTPRSTFALGATAEDASDSTPEITINGAPDNNRLDVGAMTKYVAAIAVQMSLLTGLLSGLDGLAKICNVQSLPFGATTMLFYVLSLRSRIFNPLANRRPSVKTLEAGSGADVPRRIMPKWTPPGPVFPVVWILLVGPLRAVSSSLVYQTTHRLAHPAILALMLHLSIGDVWNTVNNVERRYGAAVPGVLLVWASKAFAASHYFQVNPVAGKLLALPLVWLTIASALVASTWRLNPLSTTGKLDKWYPTQGQARTEFVWFQSKS